MRPLRLFDLDHAAKIFQLQRAADIVEVVHGEGRVFGGELDIVVVAGETDEFRASDHVRALHRHAGGKFLDYAVVNVRSIASALKKRYARQAALPVENDIDTLMKMGLKVLTGNLSSNTDRVRHDPDATAAVVVKLAQEGRQRKNG